MNAYKVFFTGTYKVSTLINADSSEQALEIANEYGIERIEELILEQGIDNVMSTIANTNPVTN